ncbi:hypothetical protein RDWZM_003352 [Blomia tropicalis]|uniref:WD repeat, SAM and U-box domain-containing protein 1 n=1 Tax=Blomia tropicalis TaxID=40697 RepID=A0A9Q0MHW4_BLOTA|nr:hypothetical protein RDWZM_003352 [Blomia tropicalis]
MDALYQVLDGHQSDVNWVDFSGQRKLVSCSNDQTIKLWEADNEERQFRPQSISPLKGHAYGVNCVRYSPFGTIIASASTDGNIILWNSQTGEQVVKLMHDSGSAIRVCCFSPSSALLATGSDDETLVVWDISTRRKIKSSSDHEAKITGCAFTPESAFLVSCSSAGDLKLWDTKHGAVNYLLTYEPAHDLGVLSCDFSSQYEVNVAEGPLQSFYLLATGGNDDLVKLWHVRCGVHCTITLSHKLVGHNGNVNCCKFSMDGTLLASAGGDKAVIVWDPRTGNMIHRLVGHSRYVTTCAFSDDNQLLASGSNDKTIIIWNIDNIHVKEIDVNLDRERSNVEKEEDANENGDRERTNDVGNFNRDKYVADWSESDVIDWVVSLGFSKYCSIFRAHHIDEPLGHRNKILRSIMTIKNPLWQQLADDEQNNLRKPSEFCCPITHEIMVDPVIAAGCTIVTGTSSLSTNATTDNILQYKMNLLQQLLNLEKVDPKTIEHYSNRLIVLPLNLTSMSSVAIFAEHVTQVIDRLDFLICNGGVMFVPFSLTRDKQECHMSVNYFGHCLLIFKLIGLLGKGNPNGEKSRIIVVSSGAHHASLGLRIHDLHSTNLYSVYHGYAQSKLALIMFTYRFDRWLQHRTDLRSNMTINCLHPGVCRTGLMERFNFFKLKLIQESPLFRSANEGAETILYTALSSNENGSSGKYFENCSATRSSSVSYDQDLQEKLWIKTCEQLRPWLKIDELSQLCPA